jgi:hypothetical protein
MIFLYFKILIISIFLFTVFFSKRNFTNPIEILFSKISINFDKLLGFLNWWGKPRFFLKKDDYFYDLKITANTNKKRYVWFLSQSEQIGYFKINNKDLKANITINYKRYKDMYDKNENKFFLDEVIFQEVKKYVEDKKEILDTFTIEIATFNIFVERDQDLRSINNQICKKTLFTYKNNVPSTNL